MNKKHSELFSIFFPVYKKGKKFLKQNPISNTKMKLSESEPDLYFPLCRLINYRLVLLFGLLLVSLDFTV